MGSKHSSVIPIISPSDVCITLFFTYLIESDIFSRLNPIQYFKHAFSVLSGKYDSPDDKGQISHFPRNIR